MSTEPTSSALAADRFRAWCDHARAQPNYAIIPALEDDEPLRLVVAVWPLVALDEQIDEQALHRWTDAALLDLHPTRLLQALWSFRPMPEDALVEQIDSLVAAPSRVRLRRAIRLGMLLPDGTRHTVAEQYIMIISARFIKRPSGGRSG